MSDRLGEVYAATTAAQLQSALRELPPLPAGAVPMAPAKREAARRQMQAGVAGYLGFVALMLTIWALTGAGFFWPLWPIIGVGFGMARAARTEDGQSQRRPGPWGHGVCGGARNAVQRP